jgi:phosphoenolpyruvate phosphomutase
VAVPTLFPDYTDQELYDKGFQMIILANHPMRAAVKAMEEVLDTLSTERKAAAVDPHIAAVDHIFDLVGTKEAIALEESAG